MQPAGYSSCCGAPAGPLAGAGSWEAPAEPASGATALGQGSEGAALSVTASRVRENSISWPSSATGVCIPEDSLSQWTEPLGWCCTALAQRGHAEGQRGQGQQQPGANPSSLLSSSGGYGLPYTNGKLPCGECFCPHSLWLHWLPPRPRGYEGCCEGHPAPRARWFLGDPVPCPWRLWTSLGTQLSWHPWELLIHPEPLQLQTGMFEVGSQVGSSWLWHTPPRSSGARGKRSKGAAPSVSLSLPWLVPDLALPLC